MSKVRKGFAWTNKMSARRFTLLRFTPWPRFFTRGTVTLRVLFHG
jgi:hypothetical protein